MTPTTTPALLTIQQAAEALGLSNAHTYGYVLSGELRSIKLGKARRVPVAAIAEFIEYVSGQGGSLPSRREFYAGRPRSPRRAQAAKPTSHDFDARA